MEKRSYDQDTRTPPTLCGQSKRSRQQAAHVLRSCSTSGRVLQSSKMQIIHPEAAHYPEQTHAISIAVMQVQQQRNLNDLRQQQQCDVGRRWLTHQQQPQRRFNVGLLLGFEPCQQVLRQDALRTPEAPLTHSLITRRNNHRKSAIHLVHSSVGQWCSTRQQHLIVSTLGDRSRSCNSIVTALPMIGRTTSALRFC